MADGIDRVIIYLSVMTAFGGLMGASTALVLIRGIVRPIVALTEGARSMGSGDLGYRISMERDDEFGKLAETINRIAERRQRSEEALRRIANLDSLTSLPNRVVFQERLAEALSSAGRIERMVAVLLLDLDHFKDVNDTLGHPAGDALLKQVAERLLECARRSDTVCRLGGDEFGIIQTNLNSEIGVEVLARRIINSLAQPFDLGDERVFTGTSIGVTVFPHDDVEPDKLIKNADLALYRAKQEGRNKYRLYDSDMNADVQERKALEQDLRKALEAEDLFLNFQPKVDLASGRVVGAEALVRWYHEERGMVSPGLFIPVAENTGLIPKVTDTVLRKLCQQIREWSDAGLPSLKISFNLSPADFKRENLIDVIKNAMENSRIDPRSLELEITEGMAMATGASANSILSELRELGLSLAIDDFGTGYSSMAYLSRFPIDSLKIDQTFVRDVITDGDSANITTAIINLAHSLRLAVVAEGVEDESQFEFLRAKGCDEAQGYWISKPLHAAAFIEFVIAHNGQASAASA
ncbi:MAG: EAL domain-containing protein [Alphaproteobacteria bacterium]|nr:EAL domain-containing protein [Alphaproteobacteria bacterium]